MGGIIEQFLKTTEPQQKPTAPPSQPNDVIGNFLRESSGDKLKSAAALADPAKADASARVRMLQERTGLPADLIERNPDEVANRLAQSDFDLEKFHKQFPNTAKWLSERKENADLAWDDIQPLTSMESAFNRLATGAVYGYQESRQGRLGYQLQQQRGKFTDEQNTELSALNAEIATHLGGRGFLSYALLSAGKIIGQMVDAVPSALEYGAAGASGGATAALIAGQAGPQVLLPEEFVTAPVAASGGFAVGTTYGMVEHARQVEAGHAYLELSKIRDDKGQPLDENTINKAATAVGMINATLEMGGLFASAIPFKKAFQGFTRQAVKDALVRPTMAKALADFGVSYMGAIAGETGTEIVQEITNVVAEEWAKTGELKLPEDRENMMLRLAEIAKQTAAGMSLLALPGAGLHGAATVVEARRAKRREQTFLALGEGIAESKTFERLPLAVQEMVTAQTKDGPIANVYVPAKVWDEYWQSKKADPAEMAKRVVGDNRQYQEAVQTGGDVVIPTGKYAVTIAPTEHNAFFAKEMRLGANQLSAREAAEALDVETQKAEEQQDQAEVERQTSAEKVEKGVFEQLRAVGAGETYAATNAETYRRFFTQMSRKSGLSPEQLYDRYKLSISRTFEDATQEKPGETVFTQEDVVKQYMAWSAVLNDEQIAQPLRDIAFMKVRDLEPHARAKQQAEIDEANAEYKARTGQEWTYSQAANRVPAHVAAALEEFALGLEDAVQEQDVTHIADGRVLKYARALAKIAAAGTFDDLNVFMASLGDKNVQNGLEIGAEILNRVEPFRRWMEDQMREPPKLELLQTVDSYRLDLPPSKPGEKRRGNAIITEKTNGGYQLAVFTEDRKLFHKQDFGTKADAEKWVNDRGGRQLQIELLQEIKAIPPLPPGFYSKAERMIEVKMPERASVAAVRGLLKDIKAEERKWLGTDEWLNEQESAFGLMKRDYEPLLKKTDVLNFIRAHRLEIAELENSGANTEGDQANYEQAFDAEVDEIMEQLTNAISDRVAVPENITRDGVNVVYTVSKQQVAEYLAMERGDRSVAYFSSEQLDDEPLVGGGVSRRAALLNLRLQIIEFISSSDRLGDEFADLEVNYEDSDIIPYEDWTLPGGDNYRIIAFQFPSIEPKFAGVHEGISTEPNVFAHARLKDRIDASGNRVLFIEEIQSDWHQSGREGGYLISPENRRKLTDDERRRLYVLSNKSAEYEATGNNQYKLSDTEESELVELTASDNLDYDTRTMVPDAPFRNTWHEFVLKRLIRVAAEGGYDSIAWTTGAQQNVRYNLEKVADDIRLVYHRPSEEHVAGDVTLEAFRGGVSVFRELIRENALKDYIGEEAARKLLSKEKEFVHGNRRDIEERLKKAGVNEFYSKEPGDIVNAHANFVRTYVLEDENASIQHVYEVQELAKQWVTAPHAAGAKIRRLVGEELRVGGAGMRGFYDDILVRFANSFGKKYSTHTGNASVVTRQDGAVPFLGEYDIIQEDDNKWVARGSAGHPLFVEMRGATREEVEQKIQNATHATVHSLPLSDELKHAALQNEFTLYQFGKAAKGKLYSQAEKELDTVIENIAGVIESYENNFEAFEAEQPEAAAIFQIASRFKIAHSERDMGAAYNLLASLPEDHLASFAAKMPKVFDWVMHAQPLQQDARGRIRVDREAKTFDIELLKEANPSTFIHETGHFYLEVLHDLRDSSPEMRRDYDILRSWMGASGDGAFTREQHEVFARGFEAYLLEGRAPVPELQTAFVRFKVWLLTVYQSFKELNVNLTEEVRGVFDRMLASEKEIETAQKSQGMTPLFTDPALVGDKKWMSEQQAKEYADAVTRAQNAASEEMSSRIMKEWRREQDRVFQAERTRVREEVAKEADDNRVVRARSILTRGLLPSGAKLPEGIPPFKLSREAILREHGDKVLKALPKPLVWTRDEENALHPDMAADLLGFRSGNELVKALLSSDSPQKWIDDQVRDRMRGKRSQLQMLSAEQLPVEAMKAVHNEKQAQLLHKELEILAAQDLPTLKGIIRKVTQRIPTLKDVREQAERIIGQKPVREIQPLLYQRAVQTSAKAALEATLKGDFTEASVQKQRELLNHELFRAARAAKDEVQKIADYMQRLGSQGVRSRLGLSGEKYLNQIDALRDRFDFARLTERQLDNRQSLREFLEEQADLGMDPPIPDWVKNEAYRQNYRELTMDELRAVEATAKSIDHLSRLKNKLLSVKKQKDKNAAVESMVTQARAHHKEHKEPIDFDPGLGKKLKMTARSWGAAHTKAEFLFEWLDGNVKQGPWWTNLFKRIADAESAESAMMRDATKRLREIFGIYSPIERATWYYRKQTFPGMATFTKGRAIAMALNWGNEYNRQAVLEGYGWNEGQVQDVFDSMLDERDWSTIQAVWDLLDSYWPMVARLEKRLNGIAPEKVEHSPFTVRMKNGRTVSMRGGYYPVVFDRNLSWRQASLDARETVRELFGGTYAHAMTRHGHTKERVGTGGKPVLLDITALSDHIKGVVHDLTHREAVIDVARLIETPEIRHVVERTMGTEMYRQLRPWLLHVAARKVDFLNPVERMIAHARTGATIVTMGWKFSTGIAQTLGSLTAIQEIGARNFASGMAEVYGKPWRFKRSWDFITSRSEFMKDRLSNYDRDVRDALGRMNITSTQPGALGVLNAATLPIRDSFFRIIGLMDMGISMPTWMGAYQAAMDGRIENLTKGDEFAAIDHADQAVRMTQGAGSAKDLATVQRGPELYRAFTMYYTAFSGIYGQFAKARNQLKLDKNFPKFFAAMTLLWFLPAVLEEMVLGNPPSADDDPEEWLKWLAKVELMYPANTIILLRDIVNGIEFEYRPSATFDAFKALSEAGKGVVRAATGEEVTRFQIENMVNAVGYFAQLPTKQLWLTMEHFYDWWTGNTEEETPGEWLWHGLVKGEPRDE